jgi:3-oxoacyl-[acyl-carrier-protein] synthase III
MYLPKQTLTAEEIARQSSLEEWVIREKLGFIEKRMTGSDDHPNQMVVWAAYHDMLRQLGISEAKGVYNNTYGHIGEQDSIINIIEGDKQGCLKYGDLMIMVAAGVGYVWGACCIKWGKYEDKSRNERRQ